MRTWDDYKTHIKATDPESKKDIEEIESLATVIASATPNNETLKAITEAERIAHDPKVKGFIDMESLKAAIDV